MAQERKKRRIVLASILKPVDDTRMFEKMGVSLASDGSSEVFIIGYPANPVPTHPDIQFIPLDAFPRLSFRRFMAKWRVLSMLWKLKPSILIFNTHELLLVAILIKIFLDARIVYDVRENHYRNIRFSESFPWLIRLPLAMLVRFKEKLIAPAIDHFFLAEKGYENEFRFHRGGWTVIENKALVSIETEVRKKEPGKIRLLFSGTLADSTGVFRAIELAKALHKLDAGISLTIVGNAALTKVRVDLQNEIQEHPWITIIGGDQLVPHHTIMEYIQESDFGIVAYPLSEHTRNSRPTKLFEYLAARLPIIVESNQWPWTKDYDTVKPFVFFDFKRPDYPALLSQMHSGVFYVGAPDNITWSSEADKLRAVLLAL